MSFSVRVSIALGYRLLPLNSERAFVADSLVRCAFELGNPENMVRDLQSACHADHTEWLTQWPYGQVLGVDPKAQTEGSTKLRLVFVGLSWKGKIVVTGIGACGFTSVTTLHSF